MSINNDISTLSRAQLARLGREYMAAAQFNSRVGYAAVRINHGEEAYKSVAIDNWMAASPIYTRRMQQAMGFANRGDVESIFKGLQLECGLSHQYFDAHFEVFTPASGRFWLASCGPLLETEPRGDDAVKVMCHDVEDPTFDATAVATNPRARMRPVHRPPRLPETIASATPGNHCEWNVFIDASAEPLAEPAMAKMLRSSRLAGLQIDRPSADLEPGGLYDYSGALHQQLHLEQLSHSALVVVCQELALQNNLLCKGLAMVVEENYGREAANAVAAFQMLGSTHVVAQRLKQFIQQDMSLTGIDAVIAVLQVHPLFQPLNYQAISIEKVTDSRATLTVLDSPAQGDGQHLGWLNLSDDDFAAGLQSLLKGIDATVACERGANGQWQIQIGLVNKHENETENQELPLPVQIAMGTVLYQTQFKDRIQLLEITA